ncbi:hypothetical protein FBUS_08863, partial [Fasciolopsis buskii]
HFISFLQFVQPIGEPWYERVHNNKTLSATRRYIRYHDPEAHKDDLDFRLHSSYDHQVEWNKNLAESLVQPESLRQMNPKELQLYQSVKDYKLPPYRCIQPHGHWEDPTKIPIHKADNAISGEHSQETNAGYSRKPNGSHFMN